jgi:hypothetical protein
MTKYCKLVTVCAALLLVLSLPALASSVNSFSNAQLRGVSGTTFSGSFASSISRGEFSDASRSVGGRSMFGVVEANRGIGGYSIAEGSFSRDLDGGFSREEHHYCGHYKDRHCNKVPEGGSEGTYLMLSGMAVFAGILLSGNQRRTN